MTQKITFIRYCTDLKTKFFYYKVLIINFLALKTHSNLYGTFLKQETHAKFFYKIIDAHIQNKNSNKKKQVHLWTCFFYCYFSAFCFGFVQFPQ